MENEFTINWELHPNPSPIWFSSEDVFNKYSFEPALQEYIEKYVIKANQNDVAMNKNENASITLQSQDFPSKNLTGAESSQSSVDQEEESISKCETQLRNSSLPRSNPKCVNSNEGNNMQNAFDLIFPELAWPYPCKSVISKKEQQFYMEKFLKFKLENPTAVLDPKILHKIKNLDLKIKQEQCQLQQFLQKHAKANPDRYLFLNPGLKDWIKNYLENQIKTTKAKFKETYELEKTITLASGIAFNSDPVMQHVKTVLTQKNIPPLQIPEAQSSIDLNILANSDPIYCNSSQDDAQKEKLTKISLEHNIDVILSSESLITLVNNQTPEFLTAWKIPIEIKGGSTASKKVVFIGDPLPPNSVSTREANFMFFREALRDMMRKPTRSDVVPSNTDTTIERSEEGSNSRKSFEPQPATVQSGQEEVDNGQRNTATRQEQPNTSPEEPKSSTTVVPIGQQVPYASRTEDTGKRKPTTGVVGVETSEKEPRVSQDGANDSTEEPNAAWLGIKTGQDVVVVEERLKSGELEETAGQEETSTSKGEGNTSQSRTRIDNPKIDHPKADGTPLEPSSDRKTINRFNVDSCSTRLCVSDGAANNCNDQADSIVSPGIRLDMWKLGKLNMLVESACDGYAFRHQNNRKEQTSVMYKIFPKIEYQSSFGVEEFSVNELTRGWWETFLCKDSILLCLRVDPKTNQVLRTEAYESANLVGPNCPFKPKISMKLLHNILKEITRHEEGDYMLTHSQGEIHACFYKQTEKREEKTSSAYIPTSDYNSTCNDWPIKDANISWQPIDTNIILPVYMDLNRIPCLFPLPQELDVPHQAAQGNKPGNKKRKGKSGAKQKAKMRRKNLKNSSASDTDTIVLDPRSKTMDYTDYGDLELDF